MNDPETHPETGHPDQGELARLLAGLEQQKGELGPIAEELIELLHRLGVGVPPRNGTPPRSFN